jgi:chromosome segregation ATPase
MTNKDMKDHLKDLSMNMSKAVKDYAATTNQLSTHINALWTELEFKKLRITELEGTIQDKDFEISDLNEACTSQLTQIEGLEAENKELTEICGGVAHYEKKIKEFIKKESVDN